jgi:predicted Zn-dependent protease with MMP-like domain/predicted nucleic acid-binding protein
VTMEKDLEQAWELLEAGDLAAVRELAERLRGQAPDAPDVLLLSAAWAREEGHTEEALALLARAAAADPGWATPEIWAAELLAADPQRLRDALEHAVRGFDLAEEEEEYLEALAVKAGIEVDLGSIAAARRTLADLPPVDPSSSSSPAPHVDLVGIDPSWQLEIAHLFLAVDDLAEARRRFQSLANADPELGDAWHGLGLAAELQGDEEEKRRAWLRALALEEKRPLEDPLLTEAEMAAVAEAALAELPARARSLIENVPIVIADLPAAEDVGQGLDPRLLGLFEGTSYREASSLAGSPQLARILLFRKNLEGLAAGDVEQLREEIRTTLLHETGHFFGMEEDDLANVGLD